MITVQNIRQSLSALGVTDTDRLLLAVSGGRDSMCLLHLMLESMPPQQIAVAHCNFQLRGPESDGDEAFVRAYCQTFGVLFFSRNFQTETHASETRVSIQEAARNLRYSWFHDLCLQHGFDHVCTAHHADDQTETVLINLLRGAGFKGLRGIPPVNGQVIRPLLSFSGADLRNYCENHKLPYRNDSSNLSHKYLRNKLRLDIIPALKELNPAFEDQVRELSKNAAFAYSMIADRARQLTEQYLTREGQMQVIQLLPWIHEENAHLFLFEILSPMGFNYEQCLTISKTFANPGSKTFISSTHQLYLDRNRIIIQAPGALPDMDQAVPALPFHFAFHERQFSLYLSKPGIAGSKNLLLLDREKLNMNLLRVRNWRDGDRFKPLGMKGTKKLSDFFVDSAVSIPHKKEALVLTSNHRIAAVIPYRIDDYYKISETTSEIVVIEWTT